MPFFKDTETNAIVFYPKLYNNKYMNGEIDPIEDFDKCVAVVNGAVVGEGYPEDLYDDPHDMLFLKEDWFGTTETSANSVLAPVFEETPYEPVLEEVSEEPLLAIENRELNSAISEQPTEELLTTRSNPNPRELPPKRYLLQDETPVFTWKSPTERQSGAN